MSAPIVLPISSVQINQSAPTHRCSIASLVAGLVIIKALGKVMRNSNSVVTQKIIFIVLCDMRKRKNKIKKTLHVYECLVILQTKEHLVWFVQCVQRRYCGYSYKNELPSIISFFFPLGNCLMRYSSDAASFLVNPLFDQTSETGLRDFVYLAPRSLSLCSVSLRSRSSVMPV